MDSPGVASVFRFRVSDSDFFYLLAPPVREPPAVHHLPCVPVGVLFEPSFVDRLFWITLWSSGFLFVLLDLLFLSRERHY